MPRHDPVPRRRHRHVGFSAAFMKWLARPGRRPEGRSDCGEPVTPPDKPQPLIGGAEVPLDSFEAPHR